MTEAEVVFGNVVNADCMLELAGLIFPACDADGNDVGDVGVVQNGIGVVDGAIDGVGIDIFEIGLIVFRFVGDASVRVCLDEAFSVAFVLNQNGPIRHVLVAEKKFGVRPVSSGAAALGFIIGERSINLGIQRFLFQFVIEAVGFHPAVDQVGDVRLHRLHSVLCHVSFLREIFSFRFRSVPFYNMDREKEREK